MDNNTFVFRLSERLTCARALCNLTQQELAKKAEIPQPQVSKLERAQIEEPSLLQVHKLCKALGISLDLLIDGDMQALIDTLKDEPKTKSVPSEYMPIDKKEFMHRDGALFGKNLETKNNVIINRFDTNVSPNPNMMVFGTSGSGKSYFAKSEIIQQRMQGNRCVVLDIFGEYLQLADSMGGTKLSMGKNAVINILDPLRQTPKQHISWLVEVFFPMAFDCSKEELFILEQSLEQTYKKYKKSNPTILDLIDQVRSISHLSLDKEHLAETQARENLGKNLLDLAQKHPSFSQQTKIPERAQSKGLVVLTINEASIEVEQLFMLLSLNYMRSMLDTKNPLQQIMYIDEAQRFMGKPQSARYLEFFVKTCRRFNTGVTLMAQDIDVWIQTRDGKENKYGKGILNNCAFTLLLKSYASHKDSLTTLFSLSLENQQILQNAGRGEGILILPDKTIIFLHVPKANDEIHSSITSTPPMPEDEWDKPSLDDDADDDDGTSGSLAKI